MTRAKMLSASTTRQNPLLNLLVSLQRAGVTARVVEGTLPLTLVALEMAEQHLQPTAEAMSAVASAPLVVWRCKYR